MQVARPLPHFASLNAGYELPQETKQYIDEEL
jgi:hypothetical protein